MRGRSGIPSRWPTCSLPIEHPKLIVHALGTLMRLHCRRLLLLLRGEVPQHPVDGRHLDETPQSNHSWIRNLMVAEREDLREVMYFAINGWQHTFLKCVVKKSSSRMDILGGAVLLFCGQILLSKNRCKWRRKERIGELWDWLMFDTFKGNIDTSMRAK